MSKNAIIKNESSQVQSLALKTTNELGKLPENIVSNKSIIVAQNTYPPSLVQQSKKSTASLEESANKILPMILPATESFTPEQKRIVKELGVDVEAMDETQKSIENLMQIHRVNQNYSSMASVIEQTQGYYLAMYRAMNSVLVKETLAYVKAQNLLAQGIINEQDAANEIRRAELEIREAKFNLSVVANVYKNYSNKIAQANLDLSEERNKIAWNALSEKIDNAQKMFAMQSETTLNNVQTTLNTIDNKLLEIKRTAGALLRSAGDSNIASSPFVASAIPEGYPTNKNGVVVGPLVTKNGKIYSIQEAERLANAIDPTRLISRADYARTLPGDVSGDSITSTQVVNSVAPGLENTLNAAIALKDLSQITDAKAIGMGFQSKTELIQEVERLKSPPKINSKKEEIRQLVLNIPEKINSEIALSESKMSLESVIKVPDNLMMQLANLEGVRQEYQNRAQIFLTGDKAVSYAALTGNPVAVGADVSKEAAKTVATKYTLFIPSDNMSTWANSFGRRIRIEDIKISSVDLALNRERLAEAQKSFRYIEDSLLQNRKITAFAGQNAGFTAKEADVQAQALTSDRAALGIQARNLGQNIETTSIARYSLSADQAINSLNQALGGVNLTVSANNAKVSALTGEQDTYISGVALTAQAMQAHNARIAKQILDSGVPEEGLYKTNGLLIPRENLRRGVAIVRGNNPVKDASGNENVLTKTEQLELGYDDPRVLLEAARLTEQQFAEGNAMAYRYLTANGGDNTIGAAAIDFVRNGSLKTFIEFAPFREKPTATLRPNVGYKKLDYFLAYKDSSNENARAPNPASLRPPPSGMQYF